MTAPTQVERSQADEARAGRAPSSAAGSEGTAAAGTAPTSPPQQACPISPVVDLVFSRWTTPILWTLDQHGRQRFVQIERRLAPITPKVLTQRLRQLERDGLVVRTYHPEVPPRVEYEISALGRSLAPVFASLAVWSEEHLPEVAEARGRYDASGRPLVA